MWIYTKISFRNSYTTNVISLIYLVLHLSISTSLCRLVFSRSRNAAGSGSSHSEEEEPPSWCKSFLKRVLWAALPLQIILLLVVVVACLVPTSEEDYSCAQLNNFARSFHPMLSYTNGPPPIWAPLWSKNARRQLSIGFLPKLANYTIKSLAAKVNYYRVLVQLLILQYVTESRVDVWTKPIALKTAVRCC